MNLTLRAALVVFLTLVASVASADSAPDQPPYTKELSGHDTCPTALALSADSHMAGVEKQYEWLRANYPQHQLAKQELIDCDGKPTDVMVMANEATRTYVFVLFDLSGYFGKGMGL